MFLFVLCEQLNSSARVQSLYSLFYTLRLSIGISIFFAHLDDLCWGQERSAKQSQILVHNYFRGHMVDEKIRQGGDTIVFVTLTIYEISVKFHLLIN